MTIPLTTSFPLEPETSNPKYEKPDFRRLSLTATDFDFQIYTDGSGYNDSFAGSCAVVISEKYQKMFSRASAFYGADTERAEFEAILSGLHGILDVMDWTGAQKLEMLRASKPTVFWVTDREHFVGSLLKKENGDYVYRRKSQPDLWARFAWYEALFDISAVWRERNTAAWQTMADQIASECRSLIKNYVETNRQDYRML